MDTELQWHVSESTSSLHVAEAICRGRPLVETRLEESIRSAALGLQRELIQAGIPENRFWQHLLPLSSSNGSNRMLAETALSKTLRRRLPPESEPLVIQLAAQISGIEAAMRRELPDLIQRLSRQLGPFRAGLGVRIPALLRGVATVTEENSVVPHAQIILIYPSTGGGGSAQHFYNSVRIEAVSEDPLPELPEFLRLGWMLSQLNLDLPMYAETIIQDRLPNVAALAMLPVVLSVAEELDWIPRDPLTLSLAIERWHIDSSAGEATPEIVQNWWEAYLSRRPRWTTALAALDRMLVP